MSVTKSKFFPVSILILLSMIWGTSFILIKQGLKVFGPDEVGALRVSAAAVFLLPYSLVRLREIDRKSTRLNSSHIPLSRMPSSA